jgi:hypothetical protein
MRIDLCDEVSGKRSMHLGLSRWITVGGIGTGKPADHRGIALEVSPQIVGREASPLPSQKSEHAQCSVY